MRAGAECKPRIEAHDDGVRIVRELGGRGAHPEPSSEAHGFPVGEPHALPFLILDASYARGLRDVRAQAGGESTEIASRVRGFALPASGSGPGPRRFLEPRA